MCLAKPKGLISCAVTAQLICAFVFAYTKILLLFFFHEAAHLIVSILLFDIGNFTLY